MTKTKKAQKIEKLKDGTVKIPVTISQSTIKQTYQSLLTNFAKTAEIKGFRKGKAPLEKVEASIDQSKFYQQVLQNLIPEILSKAIKEHKLKPISKPHLIPISMEKDKNWQFTLEIIEFPKFSLGKYKDHVKGALRATKIWVPGQDKDKTTPEKPETPQDKQSLADKRLKKVF